MKAVCHVPCHKRIPRIGPKSRGARPRPEQQQPGRRYHGGSSTSWRWDSGAMALGGVLLGAKLLKSAEHFTPFNQSSQSVLWKGRFPLPSYSPKQVQAARESRARLKCARIDPHCAPQLYSRPTP